MNRLSNKNTIKDILNKHGFDFSKSLGQNFLINPSICPKMALDCVKDGTNNVLEIGPGIGVLTYELAKVSKKVVSIEIDSKLLPILNETLGEFNNIRIINDDVLKLDLNYLINEEFKGEEVSVCANLPYYITSPVIMKLLESKLPIRSITVMVQKEAADRICALPGTRESGAISIAVRYYCVPEILFKVSKGSFMPSPKVDSAVIRLNVLKNPAVDVEDENLFFKVIKSAFMQRRKMILNSISSGFKIDKCIMNNILENLNISVFARPEQLNLKDFANISNGIYKYKRKQ